MEEFDKLPGTLRFLVPWFRVPNQLEISIYIFLYVNGYFFTLIIILYLSGTVKTKF